MGTVTRSDLELSVVLSSFERPDYLRRSLESLAWQEGVGRGFEVVVADDGSSDETLEMVAAFAKDADFSVRLTSHEHRGFRLARCRNEGAAVARAPYLLFSDGDCVFPRDHLAEHLRRRRTGRVVAGGCYRCDPETSQRVDLDAIRAGRFDAWAGERERRRLRRKAGRARISEWLHLPMRPRVTGSNIGVWRRDFVDVNGFDERFVGWGLEDRDFQRRLQRHGVRATSILGHTLAYHLWHPPHPTAVRNNIGTPNLATYELGIVGARCAEGFAERAAAGGFEVDLAAVSAARA